MSISPLRTARPYDRESEEQTRARKLHEREIAVAAQARELDRREQQLETRERQARGERVDAERTERSRQAERDVRLDREAEVELIGEPVIDGTIDPSGFARSALAARDKALGLAAAEPKPGRSYSAEELNRMAVSSPKAFGRLAVQLAERARGGK